MQTITVDMTPGFRQPTIHYSQNDVGTTFAIDLRSRFGDTLPASPTVKIQATKPSGFGFSIEADSVVGSVATFTTVDTMTDEAGRFQAELEISEDSVVLYTANFYMEGEANPHPIGTTDGSQGTIIPTLTLLVERVEAAAASVLDMTVNATTLAAGSQATYSYDEDTNTATFGIPQGEAGAGAAGVTASAYSSSSTYAVGDYVIHNSNLYRCTTAITTAEAFTAAHWTQVVLGDDVSDLKSDLDAEIDSTSVVENEFTSINWDQRYVNPTSGNNSGVSNAYICLTSFVEGANKVKAKTGYKFAVYAYSKDGTYVGCWDGTQFAKSWDWKFINEFSLLKYSNYKFRFTLINDAETNIAVSEYTNIVFSYNAVPKILNKLSFYDSLLDYTPLDIMELGSINATPVPDEPWWVNSTTRIRTMRDHLIPLSVGDKITLTDYSAVTMWLVWEKSNGTWGSSGTWLYADYTVSEAGGYALLVRNVTEATVSDINDLAKYIVIEKKTSIYNDVYADIEKNQRRNWFTKSINHRGFGRTAPENTLPAFRLSAKYGWKYVETDVRFTSDGVAVLLHDESINRTARNADGTEIATTINIGNITYEQALVYDFGIWMGTQYAGTKIPTLEEFLILCKKLSLNAYLELKNYSDADVAYITNMVNRCGMRNHVSYLCFGVSALERVLYYDPTARVGALGDVDATMITAMANMKTDINDVFIDANINTLTTALIDDVASAKIPLEVYTLNDSTSINTMDKYITGVTSDYNVAGQDLYNLNIE